MDFTYADTGKRIENGGYWYRDDHIRDYVNFFTIQFFKKYNRIPFFSVVISNEHNGFYYHDIQVKSDGQLVYNTAV